MLKDEETYIGSTEWRGHKVDLYIENEEDDWDEDDFPENYDIQEYSDENNFDDDDWEDEEEVHWPTDLTL